MRIIYEDAASKLLGRVKAMRVGPCNSWRAIHIHLSDGPEKYNHGLKEHFVARALISRLGDDDGTMFLCGDGDIIMLFQGQVKPLLKKLCTHFYGVMFNLVIALPKDSLFTIYDLGIEWQSFYNLCQIKAAAEQEAPEGFYAAFAYGPEIARI